MKKKAVWVLYCFLALPALPVYASAAATTSVLIIPFANLSDTLRYSSSGTVGEVLYNSLSHFVEVVPSIYSPRMDELRGFRWDENNAQQLAKRYNLDYIIFGGYRFSGDPAFPEAEIEMKIWSKATARLILQQVYTVPVDVNLFDAIESMVRTIIGNALNVNIPDTAFIRLTDIDVGVEPHLLFVNDRYITTITNDNYRLNLKVYSLNDYHLVIERRGHNKVLDMAINLPGFGETNIVYHAMASVQFGDLYGPHPENYILSLDGEPVLPNSRVLVPAGRYHLFKISDTNGSLIYEHNMMLYDQDMQKIDIDVSVLTPFRIHALAIAGGGLSSGDNDEYIPIGNTNYSIYTESTFFGLGGGFSYRFLKAGYIDCNLLFQIHHFNLRIIPDGSYRYTLVLPDLLIAYTSPAKLSPLTAVGLALRLEWNGISISNNTYSFPSLSAGFGVDYASKHYLLGCRVLFLKTAFGNVIAEAKQDNEMSFHLFAGYNF